ncbi:hypothetical protein EXE42_07400, partial [Halorubrum sp. SP3]|uniref:hypothetical protein n=1 Tax=Halorubrum sp. SP3 TaxID=1537265 RepID=UPI0010F49005
PDGDGDRPDGDGDRPDGDGDRPDGDGDRSDGDHFDDGPFDDGASDEAGAFEAPDADGADDPFAALGEGVDDGAGSNRDAGGGSDDADPEPRTDPEPAVPPDDPFAELDADAGDAAGGDDPFEAMAVGDVGEDVWEALDEESSVGTDAAGFDGGAAGGGVDGATRSAGPAAGAAATGDERVVDKRSYCQQCPHFTAPPETACTHEGTDIVESVDFSRFRVRNCPMVDANDPAFDDE